MSERKPIDPALRAYLDELAPGAPDLSKLSDAERTSAARSVMAKARGRRDVIPGLPNGVKSRDVEIQPGLSARLYTPADAAQPTPVLVYLHGGGWVVGSVETHDPFCRILSQAAKVQVLSAEYRLAPEQRYPAAVEDTAAALSWAREHAGEWGGDPERLALGGDSAGANLAAVVANRFAADGANWLKALLLLYPVTDHPEAGHPSYEENATGYGLEANGMRWFWQQYAPQVGAEEAEAYPLRRKSLPALPPTLVATAEYDVLRDEGLAYAEKLKAAGVAVTHLHGADMHHNFPVHPGTVMRFPQSEAALSEFAGWLRATLTGTVQSTRAGA